MEEKNSEKAEISVTTLISVTILILSFLVILFLWYQFFWEGNIDREACHTSVILKKTMPDKPIGGKWADLPLRCKTEKICLTSGINDKGCENIGSKYEKIKVSSEEDIIKALAENMAACWAMMGEGKEEAVFSREFAETTLASKGVICSIMDFSENTETQFKILDSKKFSSYMDTNKVPGSELTYAKFLSGSQTPTLLTSAKLEGSIVLKEPLAIIFVEYRRGVMMDFLDTIYGGLGQIGDKTGMEPGLLLTLFGGSFTANAAPVLEKFYKDYPADFYSAVFLRDYKAGDLRALNIDSFENIA